MAGQTITVKWDDKNAGNAELKTAAWNDAVYLSSKATLDGSAKQLQVKLVSSDPVAINGTRSVQAEVKIPVIPAGDYFLIVKADESNVIFEGIHEDNNTATAAIRINNPNVDLTVTSITIPASAFSGQEMEVRWTVANNGGQTTLGVDWSDYVYLSRDQILDPTDQQLGWTQHSGALNGGASYNVTLKVNIPAGLSGLYYVFVRTDQHNQIGETNEDNNAVKATNALDVQLPPPADLVIVENSIIVPPSGSPGEEATISWMVKNAGQNVASGRWTEAVYLSRDAQWDISDALIGRVEYDGYAKPLAVGASATETLKQPLPAIEPGSYYVIVRADVRNNVREDSVGETNNTTPSTAKIAVDVPELTLGVPRSDTLKTGQERYYKVNVPGNETLRLTLDGQSPNAFNELFARFGLMPSHSYYDFLFNRPYESDQEIVIPNSIAGTYYILGGNVYSQLQNNSIEVKAEVASSGIRSINPIVGGNVGTVTIEINGSNFTPLLEATLLGAISIRANEVSVISKAKAYAVFDLRGAMPGSYNMEVNQPILSYDARDGKITEKRDNSILQEAFSIVPALPTTPDVRLSLPESIRPSREFPVTVVYSNYGKNDVVSPWVRISIDGGKFVVPDGGTSMAKQERSVDLLILNNDGIPGILRPGYTGTIIINAISSAGAKGVKLHIRSISAGENIVDYTRLYELVGKAWGKDTWDAFVRSTGATWNSLLDRLVREARVAFSTDLIVDPYKMIERILNSINIVSQANNINAESLRQASLRWSINGWQSNNFIGETGLQYNPYGQVNCPALEKAIKESWVPTYTRQRFGSIHNDFFDLWLNKKMENYFDATSKFGVAEAVLKSATFNTVLEELEGYLKRYFEIMNESQCNDRVAKIFVNLAEGIPGKLPPLATAKGEYGWVVPGSPRLLEVQGQVARVIRFNDISESDLYLTFASCSFFISKIIEVNVLKNGDDLKLVAEVTPKLVDLYNFNPHGAPTIIDEPQPSIIELPIAAIDEEERRFYKARFAQSVYVLQKSCGFNSPDVIVRLGTFQTTAMVRRVHDCECKAVGDFPLMNRPECKRCIESDCRDDYDYDVDIRPPVDPNEKSATGYNRLNFVPAINDLGYQISFENLPTAQGYANRVVISDQLSNNLDWRIFRLKEIGFGKYRIQIPPNRAFYQGRIQLGEDLGNLLADISAGINITTGQVTWTLTAIDPKTGEQPNSVLLGLLPPNDSSGRGQGYVTYTVQPKAGVPTGTVISNKATIIFDTEEPITTNTVTNTLDADAPSSRVTPLPSLSQPTFTLTWSGEDPAGGSGLQSFDIWVSEGGGPYQPFLSGTTDTSTQFTGQPGKTYHFYSVARDNAGNVEAAPPIYDTGTTVLILSPTLTSLSPNSAQACGAAFTLTVNGTNFVSNSTVNWNGAARPTTFVSATQLTAAIPASDLASAGTANITIFNPEPGGGTSAALPFTILPSNPVPAISAINPNSATAGGAAFTMTVTGTKFINGSKVLWSGKELATTFVSGSQLTAQVTAAEIATASTAQVTVFNPPPCGGTSGGLVFTINPRPPDYEADVSPRPNSDRSVTIADWVQVGRFVTGVETPEEGGEYQRADCAPRATLGDGKLTIADWVQAGRYASGLDPLTPAGGPTKPSGAFVTESTDVAAGTVMRSLRIENATFQRGQVGTLAIEMDAQGSENAVSFTLNYDAALLSFVEAVPLTDATLMVNTSRATNGRIGISLALPVGKTMSTGISRILTLRFIPVGGANDAITKIAFGDQVVKGEVVDTLANTLPGTAFAEGTVLVAGHAVANVSAADYSGPVLAVESIVAAFGTELAIATDEARGLPLPNVLAGTTVRVKDSQGDERIAPLFFVSPAQVNYQIPAGTAEGIATVTIINADGLISLGLIQVAASKPGLFSADAGGSGLAAGYVVRTKLDGLQSFEPISRFDVVSNQFALLPIDLGSESEQVTLAMFGVGIRNRKSLAEVKVFIGDLECLAEYAGAQGTFVGLDQINVRLPRVLAGQGEVNVRVSVEGYLANTVKIHVR
ncbi:MAG TPA: CARDB domain-containing protein [Blastocatellia bacterium]|nr:CARDB domain-containing protein [Blastocatellia bacterium]